MADSEFRALIAVVERETAAYQAESTRYGEPVFEWRTESYKALYAELERRKVIS
jgi:hypothetical protein